MSVWTVGPTLGTYASHTTAYAAALAAVDHGAEIRTVENGVYSGQVIDMSGLDNVTLTNANGVAYTIGLDTTAVYALNLGDGFAMAGGTIKARANRAIHASGAISALFTGVNLYVETGAGASMIWADLAASVTVIQQCVMGDTQTTPEIYVSFTSAQISLYSVYVAPNITLSLAVYYIYSGTAASVAVVGCASSSATSLVLIRAGATVSGLTVTGCYASNLIMNNGAITAGAYDFNAYNTTAAGTGNATFTDGGITDFGLDDRGYALKSSPLYRAVDAGLDFGSTHDADGNPRNTGGRLDIGPLQSQHQEGLAIEVVA